MAYIVLFRFVLLLVPLYPNLRQFLFSRLRAIIPAFAHVTVSSLAPFFAL
jgi:hypothetical protein